MERRSGRIRTLPPKSLLEEDASDFEMADSPEPETISAAAKKVPKPKKRKEVPTDLAGLQPQPKKLRGKRGLLKDVVNMPMDLLYEIFSQLDPTDLLNLSRTTKDIRSILMSRSSKSIWMQAFDNVLPPGLPECPPDLSEPQYADLVFGKACTFCGRKLAIIHTVWAARIRTCNKCLDGKFSPSHNDLYYEPHALRDLIPSIFLQRASGRRRRDGRHFNYNETKEQWAEECKALKNDDKAKWIKNKVAEQELIRTHSKRCEAWAELRQDQFESEKASIIVERKTIVLNYIRSLGWGEELDKMANDAYGPENDLTISKFCQRDITQRGLEGMQDYLNEYMENVQTKRVFREQKESLQAKIVTLKEIYNAYLITLPATDFYPNTADIYGDPNVKEVLKGNTELSADQIEILNAMFPEILQNWREPLERKLLHLVSNSVEPFVFDPSCVLDVAATTFRCGNCLHYMQAKRTITHRCNRDPIYFYGKSTDEEQTFLKDTIKEIPWNTGDYMAFSPQVSKQVAEALETCSFDRATKVEQLEKLDPIFECLACHNVQSGRCMMRWFGLYSHSNSHLSSRPIKLIVVDEEDAKVARARMDEEFERHHAREHRSSMCIHCRTPGSLLAMLEHVKTTHEIAKPKPGVDVIIRPGVSREPDLYRFWPPRLREDVEEMMGESGAS